MKAITKILIGTILLCPIVAYAAESPDIQVPTPSDHYDIITPEAQKILDTREKDWKDYALTFLPDIVIAIASVILIETVLYIRRRSKRDQKTDPSNGPSQKQKAL